MDEKTACGSNQLIIVLQSPDEKDAVGLYWSYEIPASDDCIDYSIEEERKKKNIKKVQTPTTFINITRDNITVYEQSTEVSLIEANHDANVNETTWFNFPKGWDAETGVMCVRIYFFFMKNNYYVMFAIR